ncbi:MAG: DinB family protein [Lapillicoccus sp.]
MDFPEPTTPRDDRREVLLEYLDFYRSVIRDKLTGLSEADLRTSRVPSGWTAVELLKHVVNVERRWMVWGFEGVDLNNPWGEDRDDRWYASPDESVAELLAALDAGGRQTRQVVLAHDLGDRGAPGDRWDGGPPPPLERILLHLVQEYARHAGHLDIVRELSDGSTGEH